LQQDCRDEISPDFLNGLRTICRDQENSLFREDIEPQLESLRHCAGPGIGRLVLDEAVRLSAAGEQGLAVAVQALDNALTDRALRGSRQVEEHYYREASAPRAHDVRGRIEQAIGISGEAINGLARRMLKLDAGQPARQPLRQQGLDDGVRL
jgi:hypothetical protein